MTASALVASSFSTLRSPSWRCGFWIQQVVDTSGTAAQIRLFDLGHFQAGNSGEEPARLLMDGLSMTEMTGIMISDTHGQWMALSPGG